jgi:Domain of unknown function (DUF4845)
LLGLGESRRYSHGVPRGRTALERAGERGAGHLKAIIWTLILAACVYVAAKVIPVLIDEYQFQDGLQSIAQFASATRKSNEEIRKSVLDEVQKDDLPVQDENIKVEGHAGNVNISVDYSVTVDLKVYQWTLNFHPTASNKALL